MALIYINLKSYIINGFLQYNAKYGIFSHITVPYNTIK